MKLEFLLLHSWIIVRNEETFKDVLHQQFTILLTNTNIRNNQAQILSETSFWWGNWLFVYELDWNIYIYTLRKALHVNDLLFWYPISLWKWEKKSGCFLGILFDIWWSQFHWCSKHVIDFFGCCFSSLGVFISKKVNKNANEFSRKKLLVTTYLDEFAYEFESDVNKWPVKLFW